MKDPTLKRSEPSPPEKEPNPSEKDHHEPRLDRPNAAKRSAEEQMAEYEQSLKDTDWGHQPC